MKKILCLFLFGGVLVAFSSSVLAGEKWNERRAAHFLIYYKDTPMDFVRSVEGAAEDEYREITASLGFRREQNWMSENRAKIYIYEDAGDYSLNSQQYQWSHGAASAGEKIIRTFPSAAGFFDSTLPHEMGHIIFREFVGLDAKVPLWFEEGVAMYQEKAKRVGANTTVKAAIKNGKFIPLTELSNMRLYNETPKDQVELFYTEAASIVYYMISELGDHRFAHLCRALKEGKDFFSAMESAYGRFHNWNDLSRAWMNYLEQVK